MKTITKEYENTIEVKQSKFIAHLVPYKDFEQKLSFLKQSHPKARHFVTAYRYLNEYNQVVEHSSDDGEPKGTSGKPSLMVLSGADMINVAVIIVRYFGGIKLGTGGLVRAYSDAVNAVLDVADIIEYVQEKEYSLKFDYKDVRQIEYELQKSGIMILHKEFLDKVEFKIRTTKEKLEEFLNKIKSIDYKIE